MLFKGKEKQAIVFLLLLACSLFLNFSKIITHKLEYDEVYVLSRASAQSLNVQVEDFSLDLRSIHPVTEIYKRMNFPADESLIENLGRHLKTFHNISNHPPVNDFFAKLFIHNKSDFVHMRYYAFSSFIFLLFCFAFFLKSNGFLLHETLAVLSLYSSISLISYQSIFPKSYSLFIAFFLLALSFWQKYLERKSIKGRILVLLLVNLCFFTHFLTCIFLPISFLVIVMTKTSLGSNLFKRLWSFKLELSLLLLNLIALKPLVDYQSEGTFSHFEETNLASILSKFIYNSFVLITMNFERSFASILMIVFFVYLIKNLDFFKKNIYVKIFFALIFSILILDLLLSSRLSSNIRFFLVAAPFSTIIIYQFFKPFKSSIYLIALICLSLYANYNYSLHTKKSINLITNKTIHRASKLKSFDINKKTLIVIENFNPMELSYIHHLIARSLKRHPLSIVEPKDYSKIENIFFVIESSYEKLQNGSKELDSFERIID